ncbi:MAG: superinfection immunity protein [Synechococcus sp.]|nr:superinfection immunity protein [Synechococcus sp.]
MDLSARFNVLIYIVIYLVPSIVAITRNTPNRGSTMVVNLFLGWTVIGWIVALAMAFGQKGHPVINASAPSILDSSREPREARPWFRSARLLVGISLLIAVAIGTVIGFVVFPKNRPAATFTYVTEEGSLFGASSDYPEENDLFLAAVAPAEASSSTGWAIGGTVTNNSPRTSDYTIEITVTCGVNVEVTGSGQIVATALFNFEKVRPGRSESIAHDIAKSVFDLCVVNTSIVRDAHYGS